MFGAQLIVRLQPLLEQRRHFVRQTQQHIARFDRAGVAHLFQDGFDIAIVHERNDRRDQYTDRHAG